MYLYEPTSRRCIIYKLELDKEKLLTYKKQEISKADKSSLFHDIHNYQNVPIFPNQDTPLYENFLSSGNYIRTKESYFTTDNDLLERKEKLKTYLTSTNDSVYFTSNSKNQADYCFTLPGDLHQSSTCGIDYQELTNVLTLPEKLCTLHLLEAGMYQYLEDRYVDEQLKLFTITERKNYLFTELNELIRLGFVDHKKIETLIVQSKTLTKKMHKLHIK